MSLGDKIKSVFSSGDHSQEASRGEVDQRTPGSFPTDDTTAATGSQSYDSGNEHKLHKKDDPRGQTGAVGGTDHSTLNPPPTSVASTGAAPLGAGGLSSSKIGEDRSGQRTEQPLTGSHAASNTHRDTDTSSKTLEQSMGNQSGDNYDQSRGLGAATAGAGAGLAGGGVAGSHADHESHNIVTNGKDKSNIQNQETYWGDLPQGAGTYNTVTGHGSSEDSAAVHRNVPSGADREVASSTAGSGPTSSASHISQGAGVYNTVTGHGSGEDQTRPNVSGTTGITTGTTPSTTAGTTAGTTTGTTTGTNTGTTAGDKYDTPSPQSSAPVGSDSRSYEQSDRNKHFAEAGAAGAVGAGAYGLAHKHNQDEKATPENTTHTKDQSSDKTHGDKSESSFAGLLHRHKDEKDTAPRETHEKHEKHEEKHDSKLGGLLHRKKEDKDAKDVATPKQHDNLEKRDARDPAAAAAAAAFGASQARKDNVSSTSHGDSSTTGPVSSTAQSTSSPSKTTGPAHSTTQSTSAPYTATTSQDDQMPPRDEASRTSHGAAGLAGVGAGAAAGYGISRMAGDNEPKSTTQSGTSHGDNSYPSASTGATGATGSRGQYDSETTTSSALPTGVPSTSRSAVDPSSTSSGSEYNQLSSGTTSGIGGTTQHSTTSSNPAAGTSTSDSYNHLPGGTSSGVAGISKPATGTTTVPAAGTSTSDSYNHLPGGTSSGVAGISKPTTGTTTVPAASSGSDPYNHLASGTPSGVEIGSHGSSQPSQSMQSHSGIGSSERSAIPESTSSYPTSTPHDTSKGLAAAGAGAGAAGLASRETKQGNNSSNITYSCTKCGEENDISEHYVKL